MEHFSPYESESDLETLKQKIKDALHTDNIVDIETSLRNLEEALEQKQIALLGTLGISRESIKLFGAPQEPTYQQLQKISEGLINTQTALEYLKTPNEETELREELREMIRLITK